MQSPQFSVPDWQRVGTPGDTVASIRTEPEDFQVTEVLGFEPSGDGEHDILLVEKTSTNTAWVADHLSRYAGIPQRDVGYAGLKDRHAVTRQWFTVRRPPGNKADWNTFELDGVRIVECGRHGRKLRRGAHSGNRFCLKLRSISQLSRELTETLERVAVDGVPNYFGEQRFGHNASNLALASSLFAGRRVNRAKRGIAISSARSFIFNHVLNMRVADNSWNRLLPGDCANLQGSGSIFAVETVDAELEHRCRILDVHPTGVLWGAGRLDSGQAIAALEQSMADRFPQLRDGLQSHARQARRALRLKVQDFHWRHDADVLQLEFFLPGGAYATAVLREITHYVDRRRN